MLVALGAIAGATAGALVFRLAQRDARTDLPAHWQSRLALVTAALCAAVAWRIGFTWELPAFLALPVFGVLLAVIDLRTRLLPNALLAPFAATAAVLLVPALVASGLAATVGTILGCTAMFALYLVLAVVRKDQLGMGDVKLAAVLGLLAGYAGYTVWVVTALGGFVIGGAAAVWIVVARGGSRHSLLPFGPAMVAAALIAVLGWR